MGGFSKQVSIVILVCLSAVTIAGEKNLTGPVNKERIIHFPKDRSLGKLKIQTGIPASPYDLDNSAWGTDWEYIGQAMGDVPVPEDKRVQLLVNRADSRDFSALRKLGPNDLYMLIIDYSVGPAIRPDETIMPHLSGLTGLKDLHLYMNNITHKGLQHIKGLKSLKKLVLSVESRFGDAALAELSELRSLEVLAFSGSRTDSSLRHLTKLTSLRELRLDVSEIRGPGLVHLEKLPSLRYLILSGKNFGDGGLAYITNLKSLRRLKLWGSELQITDTGLAQLSKLTGLEELNFIRINRITDRGIVHLKPLRSLKKVDFHFSPITDKGLAHLTDLDSLESLKGVNLTNEGMAYLEQFGNLKCLDIRASRERPFTDTGLKHLAGLRYLEDLSISNEAITDAGLSYIARLNNLKKLHLDAVLINDEGLAKLTALKCLDDMSLRTPKVTASGLTQLNALPNLTNLHVYSFAKGESVLDISDLTKLRKLDFAWNCPIRDKDLAFLGELKQLRRLRINSSQTITDSGMAHLAGLTFLNSLSLYGNHELTDNGLLYLSGMKRLGRLCLCGDFTDAGLRCLEAFTSINSLHITSKRRFSAAAIRQLRRKLPNLGTFQIQLKDSSSNRAERRR
jgi:Leucine-rich repeat (LRR) protein